MENNPKIEDQKEENQYYWDDEKDFPSSNSSLSGCFEQPFTKRSQRHFKND